MPVHDKEFIDLGERFLMGEVNTYAEALFLLDDFSGAKKLASEIPDIEHRKSVLDHIKVNERIEKLNKKIVNGVQTILALFK